MDGMIRVGILTCSDRCSRREKDDASGPAIQKVLPSDAYVVALYAVVPDDRKIIQETLRRWCDEYHCDVILTTGGTGLSPTDVTPDATERVSTRLVPNISQFLLIEGLKQTPLASLSRALSVIRGSTLIVNLPGNPSAAALYSQILTSILPHAVAVIRAEQPAHADDTYAA